MPKIPFSSGIELHGSETITSGQYFARGEQSETLLKPVGFSEGSGTKRPPGDYTKNMGRGEIYHDTIKQGYAYKPGTKPEFITKQALDTFLNKHREKNQSFGLGEESLYSLLLSGGLRKTSEKPNAIFTEHVNFSNTQASFSSAMLNIVRAPSETDYSFQADVYLYPESVKVNLKDEKFRKKYLVVSTDYWALDGHHHNGTHNGTHNPQPLNLTQAITDTVQSIIANQNKDGYWNLTIAISSDYSGKYHFENPVIKFQ